LYAAYIARILFPQVILSVFFSVIHCRRARPAPAAARQADLFCMPPIEYSKALYSLVKYH